VYIFNIQLNNQTITIYSQV